MHRELGRRDSLGTKWAYVADDPSVPVKRLWWLAGLLSVALLPILTTPVLPLIDFYDHVARYFVLAHVDNSRVLANNYRSSWALLPNIGLDIVGVQLLRLVSMRPAAQILVALIFVVQYSGLLMFHRVLTGRLSPLVAVLAVPILYSFVLTWGFANFLLGLGLVFWTAAWWLSQRNRLLIALPIAIGLAIIIFFTHGVAFALYGVLVASLEVGLWLDAQPRRLAKLGVRLLPLAAQAVIPVLLFIVSSTAKSSGGITNADASIAQLYASGHLLARFFDLVVYRLTTIVRVEEGPVAWFDLLTFVAQIAIISLLVGLGRARVVRAALPALAAAMLLVVLTPPTLFGIGFVADRMPLFAAMLAITALQIRPSSNATGRAIFAGLSGIAAMRLVVTAVGWHSYAADYVEFRSIAIRLPAGALVNDVIAGTMPRLGTDARCQMYGPLLIGMDGTIGRLFASPNAQPMRLSGPLARAVNRLPSPTSTAATLPGFGDDVIAAAGPAGFSYSLVCNPDRLTRPLPEGTQLIARTRRFALLKFASVR